MGGGTKKGDGSIERQSAVAGESRMHQVITCSGLCEQINTDLLGADQFSPPRSQR